MIRRYYATKDNTITNAFEENLVTRGTGSNMGASDILETFTIYGQASSASVELTRFLIEFDTTQISSDRTASNIPDSGSVSFFLKLYNAPHSQTTPSDFDLTISAVSQSWEEGYGLDMDYYEDITRDGIGSNWINAKERTAASATLDLTSDIILTSTTKGTTRNTNTFKTVVNSPAANPGEAVLVSFTGSATAITASITPDDAVTTLTTAELVELINSGTVVGKTVTVTDSLDLRELQTASGGGSEALVNAGEGDNVTATFAGATGQWTSAGGDYHASPTFTAEFDTGLEDLEVDVTPLVEEWLAGTKDNYGFGIKLADAFETTNRSFFRKKFFGRDSEFYFARPVIEARWNSSRKDDRGNFYASSSLAPASDNLNTLYLYNSIRGRLRDIPTLGSNDIYVDLYDSIGGTKLTGSFTGSADGTGIYKCDVQINTTASTVYDVWFSGSTQYHTGTISVEQFGASDYSPEDTYILSMPGLRKEYKKNQTHRLNLYARQKNWSPNIYTRAVQSSIPSLVFESSSYQIRRSTDDHIVVPYGTGSTMHTGLSYDVSGNYFDLDTTYLEAGYLYEIQYSFYDEENGWEEQPYRFKFRVVD
jgi:hypothetical protein